MAKAKEVVVKTLKTTQDFTELLSLAELNTQMEVMGFLQDNLFEYQMNYFKSHLMTWDELMDFIPKKDMPLYFPRREMTYGEFDRGKGDYKTPHVTHDYNFDYATMNYLPSKRSYSDPEGKWVPSNKDFFLLDTKKKLVHNFNKKFLNKFKFFYKEGRLQCKYFDSRQYISFEAFTECYNHNREHRIDVEFNLNNNLLFSYKDTTEDKNRKRCGRGDYGHWSGKRHKNISDEED